MNHVHFRFIFTCFPPIKMPAALLPFFPQPSCSHFQLKLERNKNKKGRGYRDKSNKTRQRKRMIRKDLSSLENLLMAAALASLVFVLNHNFKNYTPVALLKRRKYWFWDHCSYQCLITKRQSAGLCKYHEEQLFFRQGLKTLPLLWLGRMGSCQLLEQENRFMIHSLIKEEKKVNRCNGCGEKKGWRTQDTQ